MPAAHLDRVSEMIASLLRTSALSIAAATAALLVLGTGRASTADESALPQGLVKDQPSSGMWVETEQGFMVPYTAKIPGTEIEYQMVPVPGGTLTMGSAGEEAGRGEDEGPQRKIKIEPFWIGKHEVTWKEYRHFMETYNLFKKFETNGVRKVEDDNKTDAVTIPTPLYDPSFTFVLGEEPDQPAVTMSHFAARQYTKWLSLMSQHVYRLPTEAEWEYAARAGTDTAYFFGDDPEQIGEYAWYYDNADESYHEVGTKQPNPWGIHDIYGNVAELVLDQYKEDAYQGSDDKELSSSEAVVWTTKMFPHVIRGGSFYDDPEKLRSAARGQTEDWRMEDPNLPRSPWWFTDEPALAVGFRLVRPLEKPNAEQLAKVWETDNEVLQMAVEDRLSEGRGVLGLVDPELPKAAAE